jgi:hypothetical protein
MSWDQLGKRARAWRVVHAGWSVLQLGALGYIWTCAVTGRRDARLWGSVAFLGIEGAGLAIGRGSCPMAGMQRRFGDPVPFFELLLPPRAAKAAVPFLALVSAAGIASVIVRRPGLARRSSAR